MKRARRALAALPGFTAVAILTLAFELGVNAASVARPAVCRRFCMAKPQMQTEPKPPYPEQKLDKPGIEAELTPRPRYKAPKYRPAGKRRI